MSFFYGDINSITEKNDNYREVVTTTPNMQLVIMSLKPSEEIGMEKHPYITQFIRIEEGTGLAIIDDKECSLYPGIALVIPLNTYHNIINTSLDTFLKLYTIYSPPNHPSDRLDINKPEND